MKYLTDPWKKRETDKMLDLLFAGRSLDRISEVLQRDPREVRQRIEAFKTKERLERYEPIKRFSRKGVPYTKAELVILRYARDSGASLQSVSKVLQRSVDELEVDKNHKKESELKQIQTFAPSLDLVLALRYLFFIRKVSVMPDKVYDDMLFEEIEYGAGAKILEDQCSASNVPVRILHLADYLQARFQGGNA